MAAFAACLVGAGATLGLVAGLPLLVAMLGLALLTALAMSVLPLAGFSIPYSGATITVVAILAIQVGYGLGVGVRALARQVSRQRAMPGTVDQRRHQRSNEP